MASPTYTQAIIRKCEVNGVDLFRSVRELYVGSSILTPYVVAKLKVLDASMIQDALYESGAKVSIVYTAGNSSDIREFELVTMGNMGGIKLESGRAGLTTLSAISPCYFSMQNEHTSFHSNVPTSEAMKKLHKEMDSKKQLNVDKTKGLIGSVEPFHLRGIKLGKGLNIIRSRMTDEKYKSGAFVYYQDQLGEYYCSSVEKLFDGSGGPTFHQRMPGVSFLQEQNSMAYNIIALKKGDADAGYGTDNATNYQSATRQRGGTSNTGFDWASMTYKAPSSADQDLSARASAGKTVWKGDKGQAASMVNHKFDYDKNQKSGEDYEGDRKNKNLISGIIMQGSTLINVPLEGGLKSVVGRIVNLELPSETGDGPAKKSTHGGKHLVIAQGEYLNMGDSGMMGTAAIQTSSGGQQGSVTD